MTPAIVDALPAIAAVLIAGALFSLVQAVASARGGDEYARSRRRLDAIAAPVDIEVAELALRARRATRRASGSLITADLRRAGLAWTTTDYLVMTLVTGSVLGVVVYLITGMLIAALPIGLVGCAIPTMIVRSRGGARSSKFNGQVVETIELIASSLRSGFGFMQSLDLASREQPPPIGDELRQVVREVDMGVSVDDALERLVTRTRDADLELVVQAVLVQRRVGGDLGDVLGRIGSMIRDRIRIRGEIHTLTAQARMSAWIVGMLPLGLAGVTAMLQPQQIAVLFTEPIGQLLVALALTLQVVGFILVRRVADIKY